MLNLTICDDSQIEIDQMLLLLEEFSNNNPGLQVQTFTSPLGLIKALERGKNFDIYLLDIVMPELSGIDLGSIIRVRNPNASIIFFTNSTEYALNAYKISALQYLLKPVKKSALFNALNQSIQLLKRRDLQFIVDTPDGKIPLKHKDIIFIEYINHVMNFHIRSGVISSKYIRVSFSTALESILKDSNFIHPHRAYIINMEHVKLMSKNNFIMTKSFEIPISRNSQKTIADIYMKHILKGVNKNV